MLRCFACTSSFFALMLASAFALAQVEFSADIVNNTKAGSPVQARAYFSKDKMRFDAQEKGARDKGAVIINFATHSYLVVMAEQHMYMVMPAQTMDQRGMYSFFQTGDVENACSDWLKLSRNVRGTCHKVGNESVNGRSAIKYEGTNSSGESSQVWLDPKLRFPVKWQEKNGGGELRNIQEGPQPASLFEIPAGFTKMDLGGMMQQRH
jgi:hypothetical protein